MENFGEATGLRLNWEKCTVDYFKLWRAIESAHLDDTGQDLIVGTLESSGEYTATSAYNIQFEGQTQSNFPKLIWKVWAPQRCKFFLYLLLQDRLWTSARLQLRGWKNNYFCALCERNLKKAQHLFFECHYSRKVCGFVAIWSGCQNLHPSQWNEEAELEAWFVQAIGSGS